MKSTSVQALKTVNKSKKRNEVLSVIKYLNGATFFDICAVLKWPVNCVTGCVNELCKAGVVKDSGNYRKNPKTNRSAIVWVPCGKAV